MIQKEKDRKKKNNVIERKNVRNNERMTGIQKSKKERRRKRKTEVKKGRGRQKQRVRHRGSTIDKERKMRR